jgi:hypothetical protein
MKAGRLEIEIVAEIARLQQDLDKAKRAVNAASNDFAKSARVANDNIGKMGGSSKLAGHHMANLSFQIQDVIVGLQGGQKPMTVFLQQGSQIAQIAAQAGVGLGGMASAVGSMALGFARAHPVLTALAAATATAAGAVAIFTREINAEHKAELDAYTHSLGLTEKEIAKVGAASVSAGNLLQAMHNVIMKATGLGSIYKTLGNVISTVLSGAATAAKYAAAGIYAFFAGAVDNIKETWSRLPAVLGEASVAAANAAIRAIEGLINKSIDGLNSLVAMINPILGTAIQKIGHVDLPELKSQFAGAGRAAATAFAGNYETRFNQALGGMAKASRAVTAEALRLAKQDFHDAAEGKGFLDQEDAKKAGKKAGKAAADAMQKELERLFEWASKSLSLAFGQIGRDWKKSFEDSADKSWDEAMKSARIAQDVRVEKRIRQAEEDRRRAIDTANDIADIIGGRIGGALSELAAALDRAFPEFMSKIGGGLGGKIGGALGSMSAGAQIGSGVGGIMDALGIKTSQTGAQIGGAIGQFAGPLGAIAGSIVGGLIGGMLKKTPKASATVSIIAGEAMETAITGNKARLREIAGGMADSLISGLSDLADQFGAELGNATVSVGMRKKNYVVDPTGQGRTKGAGVINFGKDEAAAMEFAIRDAISDGVFVGLSAGIERLLKGEGSLDKQLQKALSLQSVMTEAQNLGNPSGAALTELDKWRTAMIKIVTEAGEGMTEVEAVYANRRTAIAEEAAKAAFDAARPRRELEIEIMRLSGKETEALSASRRLELDGMEASIRPLQERAWALRDEAEKLAAFKTEREALNIQLWQAMGREDLLRQNALEKLDPLNRSIQEWIWRIEDGNKAAQEAAQAAAEAARATEELAAAQKAAADEMAAKARAIAQERYSLDTQYYQLIGDTVALRARELELLDPSNRSRQQEIWAIQDAMAANDAAAKARAEAIKATQDAIRADIDQRNDLIQSYNSQASAIGGLIDRFSGLAASIREFKAGLFGGSGNLGYDAAKAEFQRTSRMAALGNESSLQSFTGSAQAFLSAARDNAGSLVDYQRAIGLVAGASDAAAKGADGVAQQAAQQLNILQAQAAELEALNAQSAAQIEALEKVSTVQANEVAPTLDDLLREQKAAREDSATTRKDQQAEALSMISALNVIASRIARWDRGDYAAVGNDSDTPLTATVSGSVAALITNTGAAEAVPVDTTP